MHSDDKPAAHKDMLGRAGVIPLAEAESRLQSRLATIARGAHEMVPLLQCLGRVLAQDLTSTEAIPPQARSVMDGYAVRASDTFGATEGMPAYLTVSGEVKMGMFPDSGPEPECCFKIATGGLMPPGTDAVVMLEHTVQTGTELIEVVMPVAPGENCIGPGDDVKAGELILAAGRSLRPQDLGLLAGLGQREVPVTPLVRVGVFSTGDEIVPFTEDPPPGMFRDMNGANIAALAQKNGAIVTSYGVVSDDEALFLSTSRQALADNDCIIFSGSSSVGSRDLGEKVVCQLGELLIHGVAIKPGKPVLIAFSGDKALFGLPGHPVSAAVAFELFVRPVIEALSGRKIDGLPSKKTVSAICTRNINSAGGRTDFVRVALRLREAGGYEAQPVLGKSGALSTMVSADGYFRIEESAQGVEAGSEVLVHLYD